MYSPTIQLKKSQVDEIRTICALGPQKLGEVVAAVDKMQPTIRTANITKAIAGVIGESAAKTLSSAAMGLATANRRAFNNVDRLIKSLTDGLATVMSNEEIECWNSCAPHIEKLLASPSLLLAVKAADLASDFANSCLSSKIITDIRPVFDEERDNILGTVLIQELILEYHSPEGERKVAIALDVADIEDLRRHCDEAIRKAESAKKIIELKMNVETLLPGDNVNG